MDDNGNVVERVKSLIKDVEDYSTLNEIREVISEQSPVRDNPVDLVKWVDVDKVRANDYNPNQVADNEMRLLYKSIKEDGYTQPVVVVEDDTSGDEEYEIVDGFHRYLVLKRFEDIKERSDGKIPITIIDSGFNERMASTIRHKRARGKHSLAGKGDVVLKMLKSGWSDERICKELGMEKEELARLKHLTGFSKLFEDVDYQDAWKATHQLKVEKKFGNENTP